MTEPDTCPACGTNPDHERRQERARIANELRRDKPQIVQAAARTEDAIDLLVFGLITSLTQPTPEPASDTP